MGVSSDDTASQDGHSGMSPDKDHPPKEYHMRIALNYITPLLAAGAVAAAIAAAPIADAAPTGKSCAGAGSGTVCQSPGNVEINNAPPPVSFYPYGNMPFLLGGGGHR
jgi:hypothetical protein